MTTDAATAGGRPRAVVIGSGFGGSVAALRLAQKGYAVTVLEQGRRIAREDVEAADRSPRHLLFAPALGLRGYFRQTVLRHVGVIAGVGVGGGSLVYAAVLLRPDGRVFGTPAWRAAGADWARELAPHFAEAERMLGVAPNPFVGPMDEHLRRTAELLGAAASFRTALPLGITFGPPGQLRPDPHFGGDGPPRAGCVGCGGCLTGCPHGAKNSLDRNYLWFAERLGARVVPERRAETIRPRREGGYDVLARDTFQPWSPLRRHPAEVVVVAAGVLGTLELLFRCRDVDRSLPHISPALGHGVRTNSEAIVAALADDPAADLATGGPTITSDFYPDAHTHITQNRVPAGHRFMRAYYGPLVDGQDPRARRWQVLATFARHPWRSTPSLRARRWRERTVVLTVMQDHDSELRLSYGRSAGTFGRRALRSHQVGDRPVPSELPVANAAARALARALPGTPLNGLVESVAGRAVTAHILGGARIGTDPADAVLGPDHQLFGHPGIYVVDGAAVPGNLGVNPSLTITALAERALAAVPG